MSSLILNRMLSLLISLQLDPALATSAKYNRKANLKKNSVTFNDSNKYLSKLKAKTLLFDRDYTKNFSQKNFSPTEKLNLISKIENVFEEHDKNMIKNNLIEIFNQSYIRAFIKIYFIYLQHKINIYLQKHHKNEANFPNDLGYVVSVDIFLLDQCFLGSTSVLKEALILSGVAHLDTIREQVRVIIQGEHNFPLLKQKTNLDLPLRSYFVRAQLYVSSIQMSL